MRLILIAVSAFAFAGSNAIAQTTPASCAAFNDVMEQTAKTLAYDADTSGDVRGAVQATQRATEMSAALALAQVNIDLMKSNNCPLPQWPMSAARYGRAMSACSAAAEAGAKDALTICNRSTWTPTAP